MLPQVDALPGAEAQPALDDGIPGDRRERAADVRRHVVGALGVWGTARRHRARGGRRIARSRGARRGRRSPGSAATPTCAAGAACTARSRQRACSTRDCTSRATRRTHGHGSQRSASRRPDESCCGGHRTNQHRTSANDRPESAFSVSPERCVEFRRRQIEHGVEVLSDARDDERVDEATNAGRSPAVLDVVERDVPECVVQTRVRRIRRCRSIATGPGRHPRRRGRASDARGHRTSPLPGSSQALRAPSPARRRRRGVRHDDLTHEEVGQLVGDQRVESDYRPHRAAGRCDFGAATAARRHR